jgi:undecaprenyl diphosphate synthase
VASIRELSGDPPVLVPTTPIEQVPEHVAIIMDGNGRWAANRGLPRLAGHEAGTSNIRCITEAAGELGIRYLTLWAFSTENWSRPAEEVSGIVRLLGETLDRELEELHRQGAQLRHIGSLDGLPPEMRDAVLNAIELTRENDKLVLTLAFDYSGRQELLTAIRNIVADGIPPDEIDDATIARYLYTTELPDPDLIIRTSGEYRLSNFLVWQSAYSELYFSPVLWPEFGPDDLAAAVQDFSRRERRFGNISAEAARMTRERA